MISEMLDVFPVVCTVGLGGGILAIAKGVRNTTSQEIGVLNINTVSLLGACTSMCTMCIIQDL